MTDERAIRRASSQPSPDSRRRDVTVGDSPWRDDAHAVVIGINQYIDPKIPNLRFARADAESVFAVLTDPTVGRFKPENVTLLVDEQATERNIRSAIGTQLPRAAAKDSTVLIYYAGHGAPVIDPRSKSVDGHEKYLVPHDAVADDLRASGISMDAVQQYFSWLDASQVICFLDSCYSGTAGGRSFDHPSYQTRAMLSDEFLDSLANEGRFVVTACATNEVSLESPGRGHGLFTHHLVEGLKGAADADGDGKVTIDELYEYVYKNVEREARALGGSMNPVKKGSVRGTIYLTEPESPAKVRRDAETARGRAQLLDYATRGEIPMSVFNRVLPLVGATETPGGPDAKRKHLVDALLDGSLSVGSFLTSLEIVDAPPLDSGPHVERVAPMPRKPDTSPVVERTESAAPRIEQTPESVRPPVERSTPVSRQSDRRLATGEASTRKRNQPPRVRSAPKRFLAGGAALVALWVLFKILDKNVWSRSSDAPPTSVTQTGDTTNSNAIGPGVQKPSNPTATSLPPRPGGQVVATSPLQRVSVTPADGGRDVSILASIRLGFPELSSGELIDLRSITPSAVAVTGGGKVVDWDAKLDGATVLLVPRVPLDEFNTKYKVAISPGIMTTTGRRLAASVVTTFTTAVVDPAFAYGLSNKANPNAALVSGQIIGSEQTARFGHRCEVDKVNPEAPNQAWVFVPVSGGYALHTLAENDSYGLDAVPSFVVCVVEARQPERAPGQTWKFVLSSSPGYYYLQDADTEAGAVMSLGVPMVGGGRVPSATWTSTDADPDFRIVIAEQIWKLTRLRHR